WPRTRRLHPCGQDLIGGHAQVLARRGSTSGSPNLEDRELDLIVERLVADHRKFPVVQEEPVVRDVESCARSEGDVSRLLPVLERDTEVEIGVENKVAEGNIMWPEIPADRKVCEVRRLGGRLTEDRIPSGRDPGDWPLVVLVKRDVDSCPATHHPRTGRV